MQTIAGAATAFVLSLVAGLQADATTLPRDWQQIVDATADEVLRKQQAPGLSVAVVLPDGSVISKHYGRASLRSNETVTRRTVFRIGSISKLVTAAVIMKFVEEERLQLGTPIAALFPDDPTLGALPASVTVERLLNHTSGLPDFTRAEVEVGVARGDFSNDDLTRVLRRPLRSEPGESWIYADANFRVLSLVIERISGLPYNRFIAERFSPSVGLSSLAACDETGAEMAQGYIASEQGFEMEPAYHVRGLLGEGGLCANAEDLARIPGVLAKGKWIGNGSVARMIQPTRLKDGTIVDYGLGVRRGLLGDHLAWGHTGGGLHGAWATVAHYPARNVTVAVTANGTGGDVDASLLQAVVAQAVLGAARLREVDVDRQLMTALRGTYVRGDVITCIAVGELGLTRRKIGSDAGATKLLHQGAAIFGRSDYPSDRIAFQIEADTAIAYRVYYDGLFAEHWRRASRPSAKCSEHSPAK